MEGVRWIRLTENRDNWTALVENKVKFRVVENAGNFLASLVTIAFQEVFCCMGRLYS
jgi:hypothetical protein